MAQKDEFFIRINFDDDMIYWEITDRIERPVDSGTDPVISDAFHNMNRALDPYIDEYFK